MLITLLWDRKTKYFVAVRHLFVRVRKGAYYFTLVSMARSSLLIMMPIVMPDDPALQINVAALVLLIYSGEQWHVWPWRAVIDNYLDGILSVGLMVLLGLGAAGLPFAGEGHCRPTGLVHRLRRPPWGYRLRSAAKRRGLARTNTLARLFHLPLRTGNLLPGAVFEFAAHFTAKEQT